MIKYGWKPDIPDARDLKYGLVFAPKADEVLPSKVDLRKWCSPIENQLSANSCVGNGLVGDLEFLMIKDQKNFIDLSRLFAYYNARLLDGSQKTDSGATIRNGIKALAKLGICSEKVWPYDLTKVTKPPAIKAYKEGLKYRITQYSRLNTVDEMRHCLASGYGFVGGIAVYDSFESNEVAKTGMIPMPDLSKERCLGGHCVDFFGYDDSTKLFIGRNSWGTEWGDKGYFYIPYDYLGNRDLSDDFWYISLGMNI